jgi:thiamine-phosphate pyrophosphorylase
MMHQKLTVNRLYGILDMGYVAKCDVEKVAYNFCEGFMNHAGVVQLRAKSFSENEVLELAKRVRKFFFDVGILFVVNDFPQIAVAVNADGLHIGQDDGSLSEVRKIVGDKMIVGRSTHSFDQAKQALADGFNYIGFGPIFPTMTKPGRASIGMEEITLVQKEVGEKIPMFCIGGINRENLSQVIDAGAKRVAIVSDLLKAENLSEAVRSVVVKMTTY